MIVRSERRWALLGKDKEEGCYFLGKYNWLGATKDDINVPTFRTRAEARQKKKELARYLTKRVKVVSVEVIVKYME